MSRGGEACDTTMSSGITRRTRSDRVASLTLRHGRLERLVQQLQERETWLRIALFAGCLTLLCLVTRAWSPPFSFRSGYIPQRNIVARVDFSVTSERQGTQEFSPGDVLAARNVPLSVEDVQLLHAEYLVVCSRTSALQRLLYVVGRLGLYSAILLLCGCYVHVHHAGVLQDFQAYSRILVTATLTVTVAMLAARDAWRAEIIPVVLFGMTIAIAHHRELALLLSIAVGLMIAVALGQPLADFLILLAGAAAPVLMLNRIRTRTKLIHVGLAGAAVVFLTAICSGLAIGQTSGFAQSTRLSLPDGLQLLAPADFHLRLLAGAGWYALCVVLSGFLMTGLLPFTERLFGAPTDISLLELGDAANPLLQELAHRAPGTYNHSINVASLAEAAAEAIGANGLLVRVGAYFHDIGKMLKPNYFVENQSDRRSQHESLMPAMSTLVIIAHVKDGANLGRQHHLPQAIIDFIEQHHGTTLVEYFYRQAEKRHEADPEGGPIDETSYRYPGPKPQTKEIAVLMLADAVEGASRTLVEPTPSRIEGLTHELLMKRLLDGQFDECGLTLRELHLVEERLVKSLTAVYHARVKYPTQQTA